MTSNYEICSCCGCNFKKSNWETFIGTRITGKWEPIPACHFCYLSTVNTIHDIVMGFI